MQRFNQRGVTLIELILVMVILVLITGLTVTLYPNLRAQARIVNTIATIDEMDKAIRTYEALEGAFPDTFDSVFTTTSVLVPTRPGMTALLTVDTIGGIEVALGLAAGELVTALSAAGITSVVDNPGASFPTPDSATFGFSPGTLVPIAGTTDVATIAALDLPAYGIVPPAAPTVFAYLAFGIGAECTFVGTSPGISSAPLHESYVEAENVYDAFYGRYLAIFEATADGAGTPGPIRFVKVVSPSSLPGGLGGTIENYKAVYDSF